MPIMRHFWKALFLFPIIALAGTDDVIESSKQRFRVETLAEGLENPWGITKLPDGRFLVTERPGRLRIIEKGQLLKDPVEGIPAVWAQGQGGLLDVAIHPDYEKNGWIYLAFSKPIGKGALTSIVRGKLKENKFVEQEVIFDPPAEEATDGGAHFGCRLVFDKKGHLFFSIGDRGDVTTPANNAQRTDNVKGKIHRINDDGSIPKDNPFVGKNGARDSIWSYGQRNPQGLAMDYKTERLWETEHGPRGGDELNLIEKGKNYGWPVVTFGINYSGTPISEKTEQEDMQSPVLHWTPSIAASGLAVYDSDKFPNWKGNLFAGALAHQKIVRITLDGDKATEQEILLEGQGRVRDVKCFDDGFITLVYDQPGKVTRIVPE